MFQIRRSGSDGDEESAAPPSDLNASARASRVGENRRPRKVPVTKENYWRRKKTTGDERKLLATKENYWRRSNATGDERKLLATK
jgi:hypothetical protein